MTRFAIAIVCVASCFLSGWPIPASASTILLDHVDGDAAPAGLPVTAGWAFDVNTAVTIDALGIFDVGADGLEASSLVQLWTDVGALITSTTIDDTSTPVASSSALGNWLFNDIPTVTLDPGGYVIGADFDPVLTGTLQTIATTDPAITFGGSRVNDVAGGGFGFPGIPFGFDDAIFGPNLRGNLSQVVPEPASIFVFSGLVPILVSFRARRRRAVRLSR